MKILVIGDAIIDHYVYGMVHRQSPEDPTIPVVDFVADEYKLGGCLNVAANLKSLSHKIKDEIYVSSIISDFTGEFLKEKKIFHDQVVLNSKNRPHSRELIKTRIAHSETHKQFLRLDNRLKFSPGDIARYKNKCSFYSGKDFDAIVVSDYHKGLIDDFFIQKLMEFDGPIFVDTKNPDFNRWLPLREKVIFKLNYKEWSHAPIPPVPFTIVVTRGSAGAGLIINGINVGSYATEPIPNGDPIGAGDVFLSAFVIKYLESKKNKKPIHECFVASIEYANKAAGLSVKRFGTCEVRRDEIV